MRTREGKFVHQVMESHHTGGRWYCCFPDAIKLHVQVAGSNFTLPSIEGACQGNSWIGSWVLADLTATTVLVALPRCFVERKDIASVDALKSCFKSLPLF